MFLVNGSTNGYESTMLYLKETLGNATMPVHNFEIDVIELFLNLHRIFYGAMHFLNILFHITC
jgi:hypothetical protein